MKEGYRIRSLTITDELQVLMLDVLSGNSVTSMLDCEDYAWGIFKGEELAGYCTIGGADDPDMGYVRYPQWSPESLCLSDVYIKENHRGQGLALKLVDAVLERGNPDKQAVFLTVLDDYLYYLYGMAGFRELEYGDYVRVDAEKYKNLADFLKSEGVTLKQISDELDYRDRNGIKDGIDSWDDVFLHFSTEKLTGVETAWENVLENKISDALAKKGPDAELERGLAKAPAPECVK